MRRTVAACAIVTLVAACSTPVSETPDDATPSIPADISTPTFAADAAGPDWAMPGLRFLDALGAAIEAGNIERALAFYHPDARVFAADSGVVATGWRQIGEVIEHRAQPPSGPDTVLLGYGPSAVLSARDDDCSDVVCPGPWMDVFWIYDGAIGLHSHSSDSALEADDPLRELYVGSAEAYSAHDIEGLRAFYSDAVFAPSFPAGEYEGLFEAFPGLSAATLTFADLGLGQDDRPAVFDFGSMGAGSHRSRTAAGIYEVTFAPGVSTIAATMWRLWDGRIVEAGTMFEANGWDRMLEHAALELPPAWFMSIETPESRTVERTHLIDVGDGTTVELFDGTESVAGLVEWSLERFQLAGLDPPHVDAIYLETDRSCLQESAWTHLTSETAIIRFCLDDADLGAGDGSGLAGRITMLHELAHVWTAEYLSEEAQAAFTSERGLATWNDPSAAWSDRANEHASEIIAWGLAEQPIELVRLGSPGCESSTEAFRSLTGLDPLHGCQDGRESPVASSPP